MQKKGSCDRSLFRSSARSIYSTPPPYILFFSISFPFASFFLIFVPPKSSIRTPLLLLILSSFLSKSPLQFLIRFLASPYFSMFLPRSSGCFLFCSPPSVYTFSFSALMTLLISQYSLSSSILNIVELKIKYFQTSAMSTANSSFSSSSSPSSEKLEHQEPTVSLTFSRFSTAGFSSELICGSKDKIAILLSY